MDFDAFVRSLHLDPATLSSEQATALEGQWRESGRRTQPTQARPVTEFNTLIAQYVARAPDRAEQIRAAAGRAVEQGLNAAQAERHLLAATYGDGPLAFSPSALPVAASAAIEAGLCLALGTHEGRVVAIYGDRATEQARRQGHHRIGLHDLFRMQLQAAGHHCPHGRLGESDIVQAMRLDARGFDVRRYDDWSATASSGPSTVSASGILGNIANKLIASSYATTATTWARFCKRTSIKNFKPATVYRLTADLEYKALAAGGEMKHGSSGEESATVTLETKARMLALDRTQMINDDLGAFEAIPAMLGRNGAILIDKAVYYAILANAGNFFGVGNKNLAAAPSTLSITGLQNAENLFRCQRDASGNPTFIEPAMIVTGPKLAPVARQLVADQPLTGGDEAGPSASPYAGMFDTVQSPWLSEELALHASSSDDEWYLFAAAGDFSPVVVGFLDGREQPVIENAEMDFSRLGMSWRGYHDVGVSLFEHRGGVKATGAQV